MRRNDALGVHECPCGGMVDASDSKSDGEIRAGSSPARGTNTLSLDTLQGRQDIGNVPHSDIIGAECVSMCVGDPAIRRICRRPGRYYIHTPLTGGATMALNDAAIRALKPANRVFAVADRRPVSAAVVAALCQYSHRGRDQRRCSCQHQDLHRLSPADGRHFLSHNCPGRFMHGAGATIWSATAHADLPSAVGQKPVHLDAGFPASR